MLNGFCRIIANPDLRRADWSLVDNVRFMSTDREYYPTGVCSQVEWLKRVLVRATWEVSEARQSDTPIDSRDAVRVRHAAVVVLRELIPADDVVSFTDGIGMTGCRSCGECGHPMDAVCETVDCANRGRPLAELIAETRRDTDRLRAALTGMVDMFERHITGKEGPDDAAVRWDRARDALDN